MRGTRSTPMMAMEMPISLRENPSPPTVKNNDNTTRLQRRHTPACFTITGTMRPPRSQASPVFVLLSRKHGSRRACTNERKLKNKKEHGLARALVTV